MEKWTNLLGLRFSFDPKLRKAGPTMQMVMCRAVSMILAYLEHSTDSKILHSGSLDGSGRPLVTRPLVDRS